MEPYYRMQWNVGGGAPPQLVQVPQPTPPPPQQIMAVPRLAQANSNSSLVSLKVNVAPPVILQNNVRFAGAPGGSVVLPGQPTAGSQGSPPTPRNPMYIPLAPATGGVQGGLMGKPGVHWRNDPQFQPGGGRVPLMIRQQTPPPAPTTALIQAQQFPTESGPTYVPVETVPSNNQDNFAQISPQFGGGVGGESRYYVVGQGHQAMMISPPISQLPVEQPVMKPAQEQPPSLKGLQLGPPQLVQLDGQLGIFQPVLPFHFPEVNNSGGGDGPGQMGPGIMGNNEEGEGQQQQYLIMTRGQDFNEVGNHHGEANYNQ